MKKRILSIVLALTLALSLLPGVALASFAAGDKVATGTTVNISYSNDQLNYMTLNGSVRSMRYTYFWFLTKDDVREEHPVYCLAPEARGAFELVRDDGSTGDGPNTAKYLTGEKVTRTDYVMVMEYGYPHQSLASIGVNNANEGYYATKMALWMFILNITPDSGRVGLNTSHPDQAAAQRVYNAALEIYNNAQSTMWAGVNEPKVEIPAPTSADSWKLSADSQWYEMTLKVKTNKYIGTNPDQAGDVQLSWDTSTGALPSGTVVLNGSDDITSTMKPLAKNHKQEGKWRVQSITIRVPAQVVDDYFNEPANKDATVFPMPTLKAVANDMAAVNFFIAAYTGGGGQPYLIEADRKIDVTAALQTAIPLEPGKDEDYDMGLRVVKLETGTLIPLAGATFEIYNPRGQLLGSYTTDSSGEINIALGEAGLYTVKETVPPEYHILPTHTSQQVQVNIDQVTTVTMTNDPYGTLRVDKRDAANGRPLGGAAIQAKHIASGTTYSATTDSSGIVEFLNLPVGGYEIRETIAPVGYALDTSAHTVAVRPQTQGTTSYTLTNLANPGLRITKLDRATSTPIEGVVFEIWHDGELYGEYTTNFMGEILLTNLPAGTYTAREKSTVDPYVLDPTAQWIELRAGQGYIAELVFLNDLKPGIWLIKLDSETMRPLANAKYLISHVGGTFSKEYTTDANGEIELTSLEPGAYTVKEIAAPNGYLIDDGIRTIQINGGENAHFVFTDTRKPVLEVLKFDGSKYLPGATFRIARIEDGSHYLDRITDMDGRIRIEDLDPGIYSVQEMSAPPGYVLNDTEFHVELFAGRTSQLVVENVKKPDLCIIKTDANTGLPIEGVTYTVRKVDSSTVSTVKTDANGEAWLYELDPGVYEVIEQSVPVGYLLDPVPQLITLEGGRIGYVRFQNDPRPRLRILKVDAVTGKPLPLAEFRVSKVEGLTVSEYITDESGTIVIENLDPVIYKAEEFMAPDGYIRYDESKQIQLEPGKTKTLKFDNIRKPVLVFLKTNALTGGGIPGATFKVQYETAGGGLKTIGSYKTGSDGRIIIQKQNRDGMYSLKPCPRRDSRSRRIPLHACTLRPVRMLILPSLSISTLAARERTALSPLLISPVHRGRSRYTPVASMSFRARGITGR